jgi:uncharacterized protein
MKRWILMLALVMVMAPVGARADEASKQAKVKELFTLMHVDHSLDRMRSAMQQQVQLTAKNVSGAEQMTPEKKKIQQEFIDNSMKVVDENFGWPELEPAYLKLYSDTYTEAELDGILAFYKSPVGQALLNKTPELSAGSMQIVHSRMGDFQPRMQALQELYVKAMAPPAAQ